MSEATIFHEALARPTPAQRTAYLDAACAGDPALRERVEALLRSHEQAGEFLEKSVPERLAAGRADAGDPAEAQAEPPPETDREVREFLEPSDKPGVMGRLGHYEILEVIGRGGMGIVLRAIDEKLKRVVAVKVLAPALANNPTAKRRFVREAQTAAAVHNVHVIAIHAVEENHEPPYLVMEYIAGQSLQQRLNQRAGPLELSEILRIGSQTAQGLAAAHAQGLVHRDVKPANILLENGVERVKLTDFGLARAIGDPSLTQSGVLAGTPDYMSPEQARGEVELDYRSDLFSLGSVLYAMCTGRAPFRARAPMAVMKRVCEDTPRPIRKTNREIPDWLVAIIRKLHAKDPARRHQSAAKVAELLGERLAELQHRRAADGPPRSTHRRLVAAMALAVLVAGLATTEATGITRILGSVGRRFAPPGRLVVAGVGQGKERQQPGGDRIQADRDRERDALHGDPASPGSADREAAGARPERPLPAAVNVASQDAGAIEATLPPFPLPPGAPLAAVAPFDAARAEVYQRAWAEYLGVPAEDTLGGIVFRLIPPGEFLMGRPDDAPGEFPRDFDTERPQHRVRISRPFWVGKFEVTRGQYRAVIGKDPSRSTPDDRAAGASEAGQDVDNLPVASMTRVEAARFCNAMSRDAGLPEYYRIEGEEPSAMVVRVVDADGEGEGYRLPTEAEWEYACRAGSMASFCFGEEDPRAYAEPLIEYAWCEANAPDGPRPVGTRKPNNWGLHDVHGNVAEWCFDAFAEDTYRRAPAIDPTGPEPNLIIYAHIHRGGSFSSPPVFLRSACRMQVGGEYHSPSIGFRVARTLPSRPAP